MMTGQTYPPVDEKVDYAKAWKQFEPSLKSSITQSQFRQLVAGLGESIGDVEIDQIINNVDGEGKITCEFGLHLTVNMSRLTDIQSKSLKIS